MRPHSRTSPYGVANMCQIRKDFFSLLYLVQPWILYMVGHLGVKAFFGVRTSSPPSHYPPKLPILYAMCQLSSNFRTLHPSVFICTGTECRLDKAEYQQWTMKLALIDRLKGFQWRTVKRTYGSNQCTKTGDIHENRSFRQQKGSQVCLF